MNAVLMTAIVITGGIRVARAKMPEWAKQNNHSVSGKILKTVCSGSGPSIDIARKDALDSCRLAARQQLVTNIRVRSLTIQTEKLSGFHEEVSENTQYSGLNCTPERDEVEELDGSFKVWMKCRFDLSQVKIETNNEPETNPTSNDGSDSVQNRSALSTVESRKLTTQSKNIRSGKTTLSISSVPPCESIIINGPKGRAIKCTENPASITLDESDEKIIIRAEGHKPKVIRLGKDKRRHDNVNVVLDPL